MILDELCAAKHWSPCVGLAECDILSLPQKRTLLVARATTLREEDPTAPRLVGTSHDRRTALADLHKSLVDERARIVAENRRLETEMASLGGVLGREEITDDIERASAESGIDWGNARERLTVRRLDSIDRALDAVALGNYGICKACGAAIEIERLRLVPDAQSCSACARSAPAPR